MFCTTHLVCCSPLCASAFVVPSPSWCQPRTFGAGCSSYCPLQISRTAGPFLSFVILALPVSRPLFKGPSLGCLLVAAMASRLLSFLADRSPLCSLSSCVPVVSPLSHASHLFLFFPLYSSSLSPPSLLKEDKKYGGRTPIKTEGYDG